MNDYLIRAVAEGGKIRAFAATTKATVEEARARHNTSPVITAALGRLLTGAVMMGSMMKSADDRLTLKINGDGPVHAITAVADSLGNVKGFADEPQVILHANEKGKLDVAGAVGVGVLTVIKDMGLKEPYEGTSILVTSEIAEDLTYYFATSEQTPSAVGLGVLMNKENTVRQAGGFIIQLMPGVDDATITALEKRIGEISSVTDMLEQGLDPEGILKYILGEETLEILDKKPVRFNCSCNRERIKGAIASLGEKDLRDLIEGDTPVTAHCDYCNTDYTYSVDEIKRILERGKS